MHFLGLLLLALARLLSLLINLYTFVILIAVLISWVNPDPYNPIVRFLWQATAPVFRFIRNHSPIRLSIGNFDLVPIVVLILLMLADTVVVGMLFEWAREMM